jgi:chaperonin GroES
MNVRPLHDRLLVQRNESATQTKSGLFLPETSKEKPVEGTVLAIGAGRVTEDGKTLPLQVQVGDCIVFGKYAGTEIKLDGEERLILREDDVLGIIE